MKRRAISVLRPKAETRSFRPDIQGLRAIAVLLVALAHAGVGFLRGGYVGVDVFFVISGFLITGFLLRRAEQSGRVPFAEFYAARARRILPAATLTIVVVVVASWHFMNFIRAVAAFHDAIWSAFFAANIHFSHIATDYFAQDNPPSPFQHFWTLAVEEQFYIVWPALLALLLFLTRKRRPLLIAATSLVCLASLLYSIRYTETNQAAAYFSTIARAWELGLGALIAMLAVDLGKLPEHLRALLTWVGVAAIILAGVTYSAGTQFPGYAALLPVLGSGLVIAGGLGGAPRFGVGTILRYQPFQFVGDVSYAFYLWHWPALVIAAEYLGHSLSVSENLGLLAAAFAVSAFTYLTFENPIRRAKMFSLPRTALALWPATLAIVLVLANVAISSQPALAATGSRNIVPEPLKAYPRLVARSVTPARLAERVPAAVLAAAPHANHDMLWMFEGCHVGLTPPGKICVLGDRHATRSIAVLGDSHAGAWMSALNYFAVQHHYRLIVLTHDGCTLGVPLTPTGAVGKCSWWWALWLRHLRRDHPKFLVLVQRFDTVYPDARLYASLRQELDALDPLVPRTVVLEDTPYHLQIDPTDCLLRSGATLGDCTLDLPAAIKTEWTNVAKIVQSHPEDRYLRTRQWFCAHGKCPIVIGNIVAYRDYHHISDTYARHIAPALSHYLWELTRTLRQTS